MGVKVEDRPPTLASLKHGQIPSKYRSQNFCILIIKKLVFALPCSIKCNLGKKLCVNCINLDWVLKTEHSLNGDSLSYLDMMERNYVEENRRKRERMIMDEGR